MNEPGEASRDAAVFIQLIAMFQDAAMRYMGKLPVDASGKIVRDLEQARATIDIVEMLERRTRGNRSDPETQFLERVLFELRMNYVDETRRGECDAPSGETESDNDPAGGPPGSDSADAPG